MDEGLKSFLEKTNEDVVVQIKEATKRNGEYTTPYSIGYQAFDKVMMGGVREGDLVIGTGQSGEGKTLWYSNITNNLLKKNLGCVWFSYEVIIDNLYAKFMAMNKEIDSLNIYTPKQMNSGNLEWIQVKIKESIETFGVKFIFIDHIDYLTPKNTTNAEQRRIMLRDICSELKTIAINYQVVIFLIAHIRKVFGRAVILQDITESKSIGDLADYVFSVSRNSITKKINGIKTEVFGDHSTIRLLKNRLTGERASMNYLVENNIIKPLEDIEPVPYDDRDVSSIEF